jgi:Fur family ferric uptake transcriptional regulator
MDTLLERLRARGIRLTAQRRVVAQVLQGDNVHLTADEIHDRARRELPEISRATVYNSLHDFVQLGEVGEVNHGRAVRFDPNAHVRHHHFICDDCARVFDVGVGGEDKLSVAGLDGTSFDPTAVEMIFSGTCGRSDCNVARPDART